MVEACWQLEAGNVHEQPVARYLRGEPFQIAVLNKASTLGTKVILQDQQQGYVRVAMQQQLARRYECQETVHWSVSGVHDCAHHRHTTGNTKEPNNKQSLYIVNAKMKE